MVKITNLLLLLILWSNANAWYCSYDNGEDGWYLEGSMVCSDIEVSVAIENHYCEWHRPEDPYCNQFNATTCVATVEYQTLSCPPNYSGGVQQNRTYVCQQASWTDWTTTSDNCTANPPTCNSSSDSRTLQCPQGYDGQITETRVSQCPDPYGDPQWLDWQQTEYGCTQSVSDPVSPISVTSPSNPVSPTVTESAIAPQIDAQSPNPAEPTVESVAKEELSESSDSIQTSTSEKANSPKEVKQDKQDGDKEDSKKDVNNVTNDAKEMVHGFGLVLSLDILNKPMDFYQLPLTDMFSITQEFPIDESTRQFQLDILKQDYIEDYYDSVSNYTWERLRGGSIY